MRPLSRILPIVLFGTLPLSRVAAGSGRDVEEAGSPAPAQAPSSAPEASAPTLSAPVLVHYEPAQLPPTLKLQKDTFVDLQLTLDTTGGVVDAQVLAAEDPQLAPLALAAALEFRFTPARRGDEAVSVLIQYRFWFEAPDEPVAAEAVSERGTAPAAVPAASDAPSEPSRRAATADGKLGEGAPQTPSNEGAGDGDTDVYEATAQVEAPAREPTRRSIPREQLTNVPGTRGDPIRAIELLPGVGRSSNGSLPILRGASQAESVTFLDGTQIPLLYHFGDVTSVVHPKLVEQVDVMPGNFSARYGRVTGGVIEARLRSPRTDRLGIVADVNLVDSSVLVETPLGERSAVAVAARRSNIDFVFENLAGEGTFNVVAAPVYWDYQAIFRHELSPTSSLRVAAFGAQDSLKFVFDDPAREDPTVRGTVSGKLAFHRLQLLHEAVFGQAKQRAHVTFGYQRLEQEVFATTAYLDLYEGDARLEWEWPIIESASLIAGADMSAQWLAGAYRGNVPTSAEGAPPIAQTSDPAIVDRTVVPLLNPAAYLEARIYPTTGWMLLPGVRFDYFHQLRDFSVDPRFNQRFELTPATVLKSGVGLYSQPPQYYEAMDQLGNPELEPYHALHTSLGLEHELLPKLDVDAEGFYKYVYNRVVGTEGGVPPAFVNDGEGRIYGLELGASFVPNGRLYARAAYTLSRSERRDGDAAYRLFDQDQTHVLSLASAYQLGAGWQIGGRYRYVTGNPHTKVERATFDATRGSYVPSFAPLNSGRDPAFSQLDVRVEKEFRAGPVSLAAYLDVQNVLFTDNQQGYTYSYDYSVREGASVAPFFPNLGLRGEL